MRRCTRCSTAARPCCCARAGFTRRGSRSTRRASCSSRPSPTATPSGSGPNTATCWRPRRRDSTETEIVVRAGAEVVAAVEVNRPDGLEEIAPLHIWTAESVRADRLDFRPKHRLTVLVVRVSPLAEPIRLRPIAGLRGLQELGATPGQPEMGCAGTRRRCAAGDRGPRARFSRLTVGRPRAAAAATHRRRGARCAWPVAADCRL